MGGSNFLQVLIHGHHRYLSSTAILRPRFLASESHFWILSEISKYPVHDAQNFKF